MLHFFYGQSISAFDVHVSGYRYHHNLLSLFPSKRGWLPNSIQKSDKLLQLILNSQLYTTTNGFVLKFLANKTVHKKGFHRKFVMKEHIPFQLCSLMSCLKEGGEIIGFGSKNSINL